MISGEERTERDWRWGTRAEAEDKEPSWWERDREINMSVEIQNGRWRGGGKSIEEKGLGELWRGFCLRILEEFLWAIELANLSLFIFIQNFIFNYFE